MVGSRSLTEEFQELKEEFEEEYSEEGQCSCHINPPCDSCTHPGNPNNLDENPDAWVEGECL